MRRRRLEILNFSGGMNRDSALQEDRLFTLRTLKNYRVLYEDGRLSVRNGYTRWNSTPLAAPPDQLFHFVDLSLQEELLAIVDNEWYSPQASGSHLSIETETTTAPRPIFMYGNRAFFATDSGWYWTDYDAINGTPTDFRVGIVRPTEAPTVEAVAAVGHTDGPNAGLKIQMNDDTQYRVGIKFSSALNMRISRVSVELRRFDARQDIGGSIRARLETDNAGEPSGTLADGAGLSNWIPTSTLSFGSYAAKDLVFPELVELDADTYWIVLEGDDSYYDNYRAIADGDSLDWHAGVGHEDAPGSFKYGATMVYDDGTDTWSALTKEATFTITGLDTDTVYDYVFTYFNSTYVIESRPSPAIRIDVTTTRAAVSVTAFPSTADGQVDRYRLYRRDVAAMDTVEDDITDTYKLVDEVLTSYLIVDTTETAYLGAQLQTQDHYRYDETDDSGDRIRTSALLPAVATVWKGRIWFAELSDRVLHFSKMLEEDGATGLTGDAIPDFIPLDNRLEIDEPSDIIALKRLSADELAVYFRNTSVWTIRGTDDPRNPPADIVLRQMVTDVGLIAPGAVDSIRGSHVFLSRKGMYSFRGLTNIEYLSGGIQTILDGIGDTYLDDSILITHGDSIWLAVDEDEDGKKENIYIFDIQRRLPTWRLYNYDVNVNDMIVRETGSEYKTLLAADADNNFILQLENGTDDDGAAIVAEVETQDLVVPNLATIHEVALDAYYPGSPAVYEGTVTDSRNDTHDFVISPRSIEDIPGHRAGVMVTSAPGARVSLVQRAVEQNHLRGIVVGFVER